MQRQMRVDSAPIEPFYYDNWYNDVITLFDNRQCNNVMFFDGTEPCAMVYKETNGDIYWWSIVHTSPNKTIRQMQLIEVITPVDKPDIEILGVKRMTDVQFTTDEVHLEDIKNEIQQIIRDAQAQVIADRYAKNVMHKYKPRN